MKRLDEQVKLAANVVSLILLCFAVWPLVKREYPKALVRIGHRMMENGTLLTNKGLDMISEGDKK